MSGLTVSEALHLPGCSWYAKDFLLSLFAVGNMEGPLPWLFLPTNSMLDTDRQELLPAFRKDLHSAFSRVKDRGRVSHEQELLCPWGLSESSPSLLVPGRGAKQAITKSFTAVLALSHCTLVWVWILLHGSYTRPELPSSGHHSAEHTAKKQSD